MDDLYLVVMMLLAVSLLYQVLQERKGKRAAEERAARWEEIAESYRKQSAEWERQVSEWKRLAGEFESAADSFKSMSANFKAIAVQNLATANGALELLAQDRSAN